MSGFDLQSFVKEDEEGAVLHLLDKNDEPVYFDGPDGTKLPVTITLAGLDSEKWRKGEDVVNNRRLKRARTGSGNQPPITNEEWRSDRAFQLASVTMAWQGIAFGGKDLECNLDNAKMLYMNVPFIAQQVDKFVGDRRNFSKASSQS